MTHIQSTIIVGPDKPASHILDTEITIITQAGLVLALAGALVIALRDPRDTGEIAEAHAGLLESLGMLLIKGQVITQEDFEAFKRGDPSWEMRGDGVETTGLWS